MNLLTKTRILPLTAWERKQWRLVSFSSHKLWHSFYQNLCLGTFCFKSIQQGPRGFIWDGRWRSVIRRCAQVSERGEKVSRDCRESIKRTTCWLFLFDRYFLGLWLGLPRERCLLGRVLLCWGQLQSRKYGHSKDGHSCANTHIVFFYLRSHLSPLNYSYCTVICSFNFLIFYSNFSYCNICQMSVFALLTIFKILNILNFWFVWLVFYFITFFLVFCFLSPP